MAENQEPEFGRIVLTKPLGHDPFGDPQDCNRNPAQRNGAEGGPGDQPLCSSERCKDVARCKGNHAYAGGLTQSQERDARDPRAAPSSGDRGQLCQAASPS